MEFLKHRNEEPCLQLAASESLGGMFKMVGGGASQKLHMCLSSQSREEEGQVKTASQASVLSNWKAGAAPPWTGKRGTRGQAGFRLGRGKLSCWGSRHESGVLG